MKHITMATEKRIEKMEKDDVLFPVGFLFKELLIKEMAFCSVTSLKRKSVENRCQLKVSKLDEPILRGLERKYPDLISVNMCLDLSSVDIYDFNKLVRFVEKDMPDLRAF